MKRTIQFILSIFMIFLMMFFGSAHASDCCETLLTAFIHEGDLYITNNNVSLLAEKVENYHQCLIYEPDADYIHDKAIGVIDDFRINIGETKRVATYEELREIAGDLPTIKIQTSCGEIIMWHDEDSYSNEVYFTFDDERYMSEEKSSSVPFIIAAVVVCAALFLFVFRRRQRIRHKL